MALWRDFVEGAPVFAALAQASAARSVEDLGAGLSGLAAAYELSRAGACNLTTAVLQI